MLKRTHCGAVFMAILIAMGLLITDASAQDAKPDLKPIEVTRTGEISLPDKTAIDHKNFIYTYDCKTGKRIAMGTARKRPATMCIDGKILQNSPFQHPDTAEYKSAMKDYRRYMNAERTGSKSNKTARLHKGKRQKTKTDPIRSKIVAVDNSAIKDLKDLLDKQVADNKALNKKLAGKLSGNKYELLLSSAETSTLQVGQSRNFTAVLQLITTEGLVLNQPISPVEIRESYSADLLEGGGLQITAKEPGTTSFYGVLILPDGKIVTSTMYDAEVQPAKGSWFWYFVVVIGLVVIIGGAIMLIRRRNRRP